MVGLIFHFSFLDLAYKDSSPSQSSSQVLRRAQLALKSTEEDDKGGHSKPNPKGKAKGRPKAKGKTGVKSKAEAMAKNKQKSQEPSEHDDEGEKSCEDSDMKEKDESCEVEDANKVPTSDSHNPEQTDKPECAEEAEKPKPRRKRTKAAPEETGASEVDTTQAKAKATKTKKQKTDNAKTDDKKTRGKKASPGVDDIEPAAKKTKTEPATFARRAEPSSTLGRAKWLALRDAFKDLVRPHIKYYTAHEDCSYFLFVLRANCWLTSFCFNLISFCLVATAAKL